jgi:hypothetical protein
MTARPYRPEDITNWPAPSCPGHRRTDYRGPQLIPFAVISPIDPSPARLAELAAALDGFSWVRNIVGIDQLRRGQRPSTPCDLLGVPFSDANPCDPVALVFVGWENYSEAFGRELIERLDGLASVCSPEHYSDINR